MCVCVCVYFLRFVVNRILVLLAWRFCYDAENRPFPGSALTLLVRIPNPSRKCPGSDFRARKSEPTSGPDSKSESEVSRFGFLGPEIRARTLAVQIPRHGGVLSRNWLGACPNPLPVWIPESESELVTSHPCLPALNERLGTDTELLGEGVLVRIPGSESELGWGTPQPSSGSKPS